ncbi:putative RNA pseudouridylate synthase [Trypanosoma vivax]|nr:putative RNA pseudouridylate synthase [Trypanosoma vivax]
MFSAGLQKAIASRVVVPRKHLQAAQRGLQNVSHWHAGPILASTNRQHELDKALRHAFSFSVRCKQRWAAVHRGSIQQNRGVMPGVDPAEESSERNSESPTLQNLLSTQRKGEWCGALVLCSKTDSARKTSMTFSERQQARMHAILQQWIVFSAFRCTRTDFMARQSEVAARLLLSPPHVVPSCLRNCEGSRCLEASLSRRGAHAYVGLLVHHRVALKERAEWDALCSLNTPTRPYRCEGHGGGPTRMGSLPLNVFSPIEPSWEECLAVFSWALRFHSDEGRHIPSSDIAVVLQRYAQHFGERAHQPTCNGTPTRHAAVFEQLLDHWTKARKAEQMDTKLMLACGLDRTMHDCVHVDGRKVSFRSSSNSTSASDADYAEMLFQGRWAEVLRLIQSTAIAVTSGNACRHTKKETPAAEAHNPLRASEECCPYTEEGDVAYDDTGLDEAVCCVGGSKPSPPVAVESVIPSLFNRASPILLKSKLWVHASVSRLGRTPEQFLSAEQKLAEGILLQAPPTPGLRSRHFSRNGNSRAGLAANTTTADVKIEMPPHAAARKPSAELQELRHKLWILCQLPRHTPRSLVRFEGTGSSMLPYVLRCPAKELVPWFLLGNLAAATHLCDGQPDCVLEVFLHKCRSQALFTLFSPLPNYSAFQEYFADLLVQMGSLLVPTRVLRLGLRVYLRPPSLRYFYDVVQSRRNPIEVKCRDIWWGSVTAAEVAEDSCSAAELTSSSLMLLGQLRTDDTLRREFFTCKASSLRNYHVSSWFESISKMEKLEELLRTVAREVNAYGPPLLSPEAAVALVTSITIQYQAVVAHSPNHTDVNGGTGATCATLSVVDKLLRELGVLFFLLPADKAFGAAAYFKGIYSERYIASGGLSFQSDWSGAEALLVGRSIRQTTKYPTTTTEAFFRVERLGYSASATFSPPCLSLELMEVDLLEAVRCFSVSGMQQKVSADSADLCAQSTETVHHTGLDAAIVAHNLPFGVAAVSKPAGVSTTLHAAYPHLPRFLAKCFPWRGDSTPVLFQHGLVNRIDLGTSGLVLVADTDTSLAVARRASIVDRRVEKTYRALLLYCPSPVSRVSRTECWYLNPAGVITRDVLANGADYSLQIAAHDPSREGGLPVSSLDRRHATTEYKVLRYFAKSGVYYVEIQLRSGRRHQVRQHFAQLCHPLLGDGRYSPRAMSVGMALGIHRPALHAMRITLMPCRSTSSNEVDSYRPSGGVATTRDNYFSSMPPSRWEKTAVECSLPSDMQRALRLLEEREMNTGAM